MIDLSSRALQIKLRNVWQTFKQTWKEFARTHELSVVAWETYS